MLFLVFYWGCLLSPSFTELFHNKTSFADF